MIVQGRGVCKAEIRIDLTRDVLDWSQACQLGSTSALGTCSDQERIGTELV